MRLLISGSSLVVLSFLLVVIHCTIIEKNARSEELVRGVNSSMDYAFDKLNDKYYDLNFVKYGQADRVRIAEHIKIDFCNCLKNRIKSDSVYEVNFKDLDLENGCLDVEVKMTYNLPLGRKGSCFYEKTYGLY